MKHLFYFLLAAGLLSCNQEPEVKEANQPKRFADVDVSSNEDVHLSDLEDIYHSLNEVVAKNKGKLVYVDIWASWCGPCTQEFPASKQLQEKFKDSDVSFVYVSIDRNNKAWEAAAQNYQLLENSFLARNYPSAKLFQENNVNYIPRYLLYDKKGKLVAPNAPRPSSAEIADLMNAFLSI